MEWKKIGKFFDPEHELAGTGLRGALMPTVVSLGGDHSVVRVYYSPRDENNRSPKGAEVGRSPNGCPQSLDVSKRLLRLPFRTDLGESEQNEIIEIILNWEI
jgi:dTDP-4-amino-4,6-dideoxygalactose transaminase